MGRVTRLIERRQLRRAADQALTTPAFLRPLDPATAEPGRAAAVDSSPGIEYLDRGADHPDTASPESDDAVTVPIPLAALHEQLDDARDDLEFDDDPALTPIVVGTPDLFERSHFRIAKPWYRSKAAVVMGVAAVALVLSTVLVLSRVSVHATGVTADASTAPSPRQTTALPTLSSGAPLLSSAPPAPPPPPPPPPPSSASPTPSWRDNESWKPSPPSPTKKPEINVTRAPMSVAPRALPPPSSSAPPGGGHGWHFGF